MPVRILYLSHEFSIYLLFLEFFGSPLGDDVLKALLLGVELG